MTTETRHFFELLWGMTQKELQSRYKNTVFGFLWLIINPLLQMMVIGFIFTLFVQEPIPHYYYYLYIGLLTWNFFSTSLTKATPSIVYERSLVKKSAFPRGIIPLSIVVSNFIHFTAGFMIFLIPTLLLGTITPLTPVYSGIALALLLIFTSGISLLTSALNVRFRDVNFFVQAILIVWFYATPIVYSFIQLPKEVLWLWRINPLTSIVQLFQHALIGAPAPGPAMLVSNISVMLGMSLLGILIFEKESKTFDDWL